MASQPVVQLEIDGQAVGLRAWTEIATDEPENLGYQTCTIKLSPTFSLTSASSLLLRAGYLDDEDGLDTLMDTSRLLKSQYSITRQGDSLVASLTVTWTCRLQMFALRAPRETEYWDGRGKGLRDFMRYVAGKLGYEKIDTNVPDIALPAKVPIEPEDGYWGTLQKKLDPFKPQYAPNDFESVLGIYDLDIGIVGSPITLPVDRAESVGDNKEVRNFYTAAKLRYLAWQDDGGALRLDCARPGDSFVDGLGRIKGTTSAACGVEIDPEEGDPEFVEQTFYREVPAPKPGDTVATSTKVKTTTRYAVTRDENGKIVGKIPTRTVETTYAMHDITLGRPVSRETTRFLFVRGTQYRTSAGYQKQVDAEQVQPLAGREWVTGLFFENCTIEYYILLDDSLEKFRTIKQARGAVLEPDHVALYEANGNRAVDSTLAPYQWINPDRQHALYIETEVLQPTGSSVMMQRSRFNYLTNLMDGVGSTDDVPGTLPDAEDQQPVEVNEYYVNPAYGTEAAGYTEPVELGGWQVPLEIDGTWIGADPLMVRDGQALIGRDWCVALANAAFAKVGTRIVTYSATFYKYLSKLHRGAFVEAVRRNHTNPHRSLVVSASRKITKNAKGQPIFQTTIGARRLDGGADV